MRYVVPGTPALVQFTWMPFAVAFSATGSGDFNGGITASETGGDLSE